MIHCKRRQSAINAIKFTGENQDEVLEFLGDYGYSSFPFNGRKNIIVKTLPVDCGHMELFKDNYVVEEFSPNGSYVIYDEERFLKNFIIEEVMG